MRIRLAATVIAGTALLAGCSDGNTNPAAPAPTTRTAPPTSEPAIAPPSGTTPQDTAPALDSRLTVTGVRIGHHPGFDRVVYELGGTGGPPGWRVQYTDRAVQDGSGRQLEIAGSSILEVQILGTAYPWDSGVTPYDGPDPATDPSAPAIAGVYGTNAYEGTTQSFIGVNADRPPFTVTALDKPVRLVIDIATG
ncbi:AMIN-like domain-containing (lipo)protein [Nocardia nova]|uniref:AMIN-like domain-containing (lipo)protein n=1 Tax=Nocardia nova TaxID=37330 RepID=UPI0033D8BFA3